MAYVELLRANHDLLKANEELVLKIAVREGDLVVGYDYVAADEADEGYVWADYVWADYVWADYVWA